MANYGNCYGHCLEKQIWEKRFWQNRLWKKRFWEKTSLEKTILETPILEKKMLEKSSGFHNCFYHKKIVIAFFSKLCFCQPVFWPTVVFQNHFSKYVFAKTIFGQIFSFKIPFVARHNCHVHTADSNQSNLHFFFFFSRNCIHVAAQCPYA